jgi:hypothetical protein
MLLIAIVQPAASDKREHSQSRRDPMLERIRAVDSQTQFNAGAAASRRSRRSASSRVAQARWLPHKPALTRWRGTRSDRANVAAGIDAVSEPAAGGSATACFFARQDLQRSRGAATQSADRAVGQSRCGKHSVGEAQRQVRDHARHRGWAMADRASCHAGRRTLYAFGHCWRYVPAGVRHPDRRCVPVRWTVEHGIPGAAVDRSLERACAAIGAAASLRAYREAERGGAPR